MQQALAQSTVIDDLLTASAALQARLAADIDHVIFLMQENRSFDHYYGTLRGVRGFGDPRPLRLRNGDPVFTQPNGKNNVIKPFQVRREAGPAGDYASNDFKLPHSYDDQRSAINSGWNDHWLLAKKKAKTMAHLDAAKDLPFYHKLINGFTICDNYHSSTHTGTDPNRAHYFSGTAGGWMRQFLSEWRQG